LTKKVEGENFDTFIVLKQTKKGAKPVWVKVGKTDLNFVEVREGINSSEVVYVLPSEGLIKYQQRFSERIKSRFG
jgi:HlyD family secretion protein